MEQADKNAIFILDFGISEALRVESDRRQELKVVREKEVN